jgi:predicted nucleic acid-binding Zn ribbon protein
MAELEKPRKRKWVKKWEPHKHCLVCGLATSPQKEFCSQTCEQEYLDWKNKQKGKSRNTWICMIAMIGVMVVMMIVSTMFLG